MPKPKQQRPNRAPMPAATSATSSIPAAHPPAQNPTLLLISASLFGLWFVYLVIVAVWG